MNSKEFGEFLAEAVKSYVSRALAPLNTRLSAAETQLQSRAAPDVEAKLSALESRVRQLEASGGS